MLIIIMANLRSLVRRCSSRSVRSHLLTTRHLLGSFCKYRVRVPKDNSNRRSRPAAVMLGSDKSHGYCLEMICADFLAGANRDDRNPDTLLHSLSRFFQFLPGEQR